MISLMVASAIGLTAMQAGIDGPRKSLSACLTGALDKALAQKVAVPEYGAFVAQHCGTHADSLKSGLVSFDVKNGVKRTQAAADAQAQVDEYLAMAAERYESRAPKGQPASKAAPTPTPASAPKQ